MLIRTAFWAPLRPALCILIEPEQTGSLLIHKHNICYYQGTKTTRIFNLTFPCEKGNRLVLFIINVDNQFRSRTCILGIGNLQMYFIDDLYLKFMCVIFGLEKSRSEYRKLIHFK